MRTLFALFFFLLATSLQAQKTTGPADRKAWIRYMDKIARPVLSYLANGELKTRMPVDFSKRIDNREARSKVAYLEAFGRTLCGLAPWLQLEGGAADEVALRRQYREWALKAIANAVSPGARDYLKWDGGQPLVDASFFAFGLVRSPWLWQHLDTTTKQQVVAALKITRETVPVYSNWLLFSAMIEAFFCRYGMDYDPVRIDYAVKEFSQHWYIGDGTFSDGMQYHNDYYNSYVIQPYLAAIVSIVNAKRNSYREFAGRLESITKRYAEIQERTINTDGSFPVIGRSIVYRAGAFHQLADMALRQQLPPSLKPAQVRGALTAVIKKTMEPESTFTKEGWLTIGLYGPQSELADPYITTGSLYLCATVFLPLGLPETDEFWAAPAAPWTAVKVWGSEDSVAADHALDLH